MRQGVMVVSPGMGPDTMNLLLVFLEDFVSKLESHPPLVRIDYEYESCQSWHCLSHTCPPSLTANHDRTQVQHDSSCFGAEKLIRSGLGHSPSFESGKEALRAGTPCRLRVHLEAPPVNNARNQYRSLRTPYPNTFRSLLVASTPREISHTSGRGGLCSYAVGCDTAQKTHE